MKTPSEEQLKLAEMVRDLASKLVTTVTASADQPKVERAVNAMADALGTHTHCDTIMTIAMLVAYQAEQLSSQHKIPLSLAASILAAAVGILAQIIHVDAIEIPADPKDIH